MNRLIPFCISLCVCGCASMDVVPLDSKAEKALPDAAPGIRVPRMTPYLVVAQLPKVETASSGHDGAGSKEATHPETLPADGQGGKAKKPGAGHGDSPKGPAGSPGGGSDAAAAKSDAGGDDGAKASAGSGSDTSFTAQNSTLVMRIIYLPDYRHAVAMSASPGLFGTSTLGLSFENGMLTAINSKIDNSKNADVLTQLAGLFGGSAKAVKSTDGAPGGGPIKASSAPAAEEPPMQPGVYAFVEDDASSTKSLSLCTVAYFTPKGLVRAADATACH